jgi:uncharacterized protein YjiS (DUF1127 family)
MSTIETILIRRRRVAPVGSLFGKIFKPMRERWLTRRELRRTRLHLFELSDAELRDIGLTREIADREASRSLLACYLNNTR